MNGMNYSGEYWYLVLKEWLLEEGFFQSRASPCFFCKIFPGGFSSRLSCMYMTNYSVGALKLFLQISRGKNPRDLTWNS
jgi:hypothetical protein